MSIRGFTSLTLVGLYIRCICKTLSLFYGGLVAFGQLTFGQMTWSPLKISTVIQISIDDNHCKVVNMFQDNFLSIFLCLESWQEKNWTTAAALFPPFKKIINQTSFSCTCSTNFVLSGSCFIVECYS